jgi:hypothetical protein
MAAVVVPPPRVVERDERKKAARYERLFLMVRASELLKPSPLSEPALSWPLPSLQVLS